MKLKIQFYFETSDKKWAHLPESHAIIEVSEPNLAQQCLQAKSLEDLPVIVEGVVIKEAQGLLEDLEKQSEETGYTGNFGFEMSESK